MEVNFMFIEQAMENMLNTIYEIKAKLEKLEGAVNQPQEDSTEFLTLKQIGQFKEWPYTEGATRKMILRGRLIEGVHYSKVDGKIICKWSACQQFLKKYFTNHLRSA